MNEGPLTPTDPEAIGPWELIRRLGAGSMGVVYVGQRRGVRVALKVIRPEFAQDRTFRVRFGREITAARLVNNPFVARLIDADADGPQPWFASELIDGLPLDAYVQSHGPLDSELLMTLAAGLADGLAAIHRAGIIHRDLKPANVLIATDGPHIVDFGIAHAVEATMVTASGMLVGSPAFMAPEQATGARVTSACDIFAWAGTIMYAATGEMPFGEGSPAALMYRIVHQEPTIPTLPIPLDAIVRSGLAKNPSKRPVAAVIRETLVPGDDGQSTLQAAKTSTWAAPVGASQTKRSMARSNRRGAGWRTDVTFAIATATVLAIAVAVYWIATRHDNGRTPSSVTASHVGVTDTTTTRTTPPTSTPPQTSTVVIPTPTPHLTLLAGPIGQRRPGASDWLPPATLLAAAPHCAQCGVLARADNLIGPNGPTTVALLQNAATDTNAVVAVSADGTARYLQDLGTGSFLTPDQMNPTLDSSGNVIFNFDTGAHSGTVLVVRVTPKRITDLNSPLRFSSNQPGLLRTVPGDPFTEIGINANDCNPNCAIGTIATTWFAWNGTDYQPRTTVTPTTPPTCLTIPSPGCD